MGDIAMRRVERIFVACGMGVLGLTVPAEARGPITKSDLQAIEKCIQTAAPDLGVRGVYTELDDGERPRAALAGNPHGMITASGAHVRRFIELDSGTIVLDQGNASPGVHGGDLVIAAVPFAGLHSEMQKRVDEAVRCYWNQRAKPAEAKPR
jgi:hypothetical protein